MGMSVSAFALLASTTGDGATSTGGSVSQLLIFGAFFVAMYFLLVRPQRKRQAEQQKFLAALEVGSAVITMGGLHGVIDSLTDTTVDLVVDADGTVLRFARHAISTTVTPATATSSDLDDVSDDDA